MKYLFVICFLFQFYTGAANAQEYKYHTVKKGETVFSISQKYNIEEEDIYKYNPDAKNGIGLNEKLVIPISETGDSTNNSSAAVEVKTHKVEKKETLYSLSKQYEVRIEDIKRYNKQLYSKELQTGETIRIPINSNSVTAEENVILETVSQVSKPTQNNQQKPQQYTNTREHIVLPKETKYGIARKYGMTVEELEALNPLVEVLQPDMMIRVGTNVLKDEPVIITDDRFQFYEVKPQETLFSLSQRFGVSQDSLKKLNPALEDGLKYGMVLKVPNGTGDNPLVDNGTTYKGEVETKTDLKSFISNYDTKEIVVMLPYHLNKIDADSLETYRDLILKERVVRISLDFYSGVLVAVDKAKAMGISTNLRVYDTKQQDSEVSNILNTQNFNNVNAVIGPLLQTTTEVVAGKLQSKNIPVINPLSNRSMKGYQNLFQSRPTDELLKSAMINYIVKNSAGKNIIIVADGKSFKIKDELSNMLPSARFVNPSGNFVSEAQLSALMTGGQNWVILESENINILSSATSALNRLARKHDITLLTTNKNNVYDSDIISNNHLGKLKFHYPSVDKEYDTEKSQDFIDDYNERFGIEPNQYALRGYDLTLDVLLRLASAKDLYESFEKYPGYTEYHENKFHYMPNPGGGYTNDAVYILKLNEDLTISNANDL